MKTQTLGPGKEDQKQIKILNRVVTWHDIDGISYEADPRHVEIIIKQLQLADAKTVTTLGTKEDRPGREHMATMARQYVGLSGLRAPRNKGIPKVGRETEGKGD